MKYILNHKSRTYFVLFLIYFILQPWGAVFAQEELSDSPKESIHSSGQNNLFIFIPQGELTLINGSLTSWMANILFFLYEPGISKHFEIRIEPEAIYGSNETNGPQILQTSVSLSLPYYFQERPEIWDLEGWSIAPFIKEYYTNEVDEWGRQVGGVANYTWETEDNDFVWGG